MRKYVLHILISLLVFFNINTIASFRFSGAFQQLLTRDPQYSNPGTNDWRRYYWGGSTSGYFYPPVGWGGIRVSLRTYFGTTNSPFYLELPLVFHTSLNQQGISPFRIQSSSFAMQAQKAPFLFSMTNRRVANNKQWSYFDLEDPLGALKLPNTSSPMLTIKLAGELAGWELLGYHLADNVCRFIPRTETIPKNVFKELEVREEEFLFFDEVPIYTLVRGVKETEHLNMAILYGDKRAVNIYPRSSDAENQMGNLNHRIGYEKQNIGADFTIQIPGVYGFLTTSAIRSFGNWYKYGRSSVEDSFHLGAITSDAFKMQVSDMKINSWVINGSYIMVEPDFQWIAVRDSRYAHVYGFLDPLNPQYIADGKEGYGWRAMRDENFQLRNPSQKSEYISDVSLYLGLRHLNIDLQYPSAIKVGNNRYPMILGVDLINLNRLGFRENYYDPANGFEIKNDYRHIGSSIKFVNPSSDLQIIARQKKYNTEENCLRDLSANFSKRLKENLFFSTGLELTHRIRKDDLLGEGGAIRSDISLWGITKNKTSMSLNLDYREGNYEYGLFQKTGDHLLEDLYNYWRLDCFCEKTVDLKIGTLPIRTTIASEFTKQESTIPGVSGSSIIGFIRGIGSITPNLTATINVLGTKGSKLDLDEQRLPTAFLPSTIDCLLSYKPLGFKENTIVLRYTSRISNGIYRNNLYTEFTSRVGTNSFRVTVGRRPLGDKTSYIAGTKYDVRLDNPPKELREKPWEAFGLNNIYSDETFSYIVLSWTISF